MIASQVPVWEDYPRRGQAWVDLSEAQVGMRERSKALGCILRVQMERGRRVRDDHGLS